MKDLNIRPKSIKLEEENTAKTFMTLVLAIISWIWAKGQQICKQDSLSNLKASVPQRRQPGHSENATYENFANHKYGKGLFSKA